MNADPEAKLLFVTSGGIVKRTNLKEYDISRSKFAALTLKENDSLRKVLLLGDEENLLMITTAGMSIPYPISEISLIGRTAAGVKGISLSEGDSVFEVFPNNEEGEILFVSDKGFMKRVLLIDFDLQARGGKGVKCFNFAKNGANGTHIVGVLPVKEPYDFEYEQRKGAVQTLNTDLVRIERRESKGTMYAMCVLDDTIINVRKKQ